MLKNYFKIAWRNLNKNRSHALINLLGLAIGIACCLSIMLWVIDEMSYDKWNEKSDRIYRMSGEVNFGGMHEHFAVSPAPLAAALINDFPEVETAVRFRDYGSSSVTQGVQHFNEQNILYTDSTLFDVFSIQMIKGNPKEALASPNSVVINERMARKYFPNDDPIGQKLTFDNNKDYFVTGVIKDLPLNSHFTADFFASLKGSEEAENGIWFSNNFHTYYVLREGVNAKAFETKVFPYLLEKYLAPQIEKVMGKPYAEFEKSGAFIKYHYQPLNDIHLHSDLKVELSANGSMQYVLIFMLAALFILLIACVNFMNLSTAQASTRAKEIGVRKVLGSMRSHLIKKFLVESVLMAAMAFLLGLVLTKLALPYYNELADKQLKIPFNNFLFWPVSLLGILFIGLLAGSYPAFYLSAFQPIKTVSDKFLKKGGNMNLRNSLVVFQFLAATLLIIGTIVINRQVNFIQNKKLGFERDQVLILEHTWPLGDKAFILKKELLNNPRVSSVSVSGYLPTPSSRSDSPLCKTREFKEDECVAIQMWGVDENYIPTFGMEIVEGRNFSAELSTDSSAVIINEAAARLYGFENPIGQKVYRGQEVNEDGTLAMTTATIIGVVKDFHYENLRQNIGAVSLWLDPSPGNISMKINTEDLSALITEIEKAWKTVAPEQPFSYTFMDESFEQTYRSENRISSIFNIFSWLSIFIACLGLFGLAAFTTERRIKEIGIRKVLGATPASLVGLLSKDFLKLVLISLLIAIPIAWYFMNKWLNNFAYHTKISWSIFIATAISVVLIAFITISFQSIKAALSNPIKALKSE